MEVTSAIRLIDQITYMPSWRIWAEDNTDRFESAITLYMEWNAPNYNRENAPSYVEEARPAAQFGIQVRDLDDIGLYRLVLQAILKAMEHDAREAFRVGNTRWAPFHPHRVDSMKRWGDYRGDLVFGLA